MSDKSVCDVSIGEETVDARAPNFAFLSLMNARPVGAPLARGGKLTLARCVWYPGPRLMEKACFHSCQSHLLRATPRLHTHGKDHHLSISRAARPSPAPRQFVFVILWTGWGGNDDAKTIRWCVFLYCLNTMSFVYYLLEISFRSCGIVLGWGGGGSFKCRLDVFYVVYLLSGKCMSSGTPG